MITGLDPLEARDLALLLRAGALAAPIFKVEERTIGPSLGQENIERGMRAVVIGFVLVVLFMALYYRVFGLIANLALLTNLVLVVALLSMLQAALTLPGIAGIVLTVGMAVDANVLIFERIREELRNGNSPQAAIHAGYEKAFSSIADANITTLIAAIVLFTFGTGPIRGFAVTCRLASSPRCSRPSSARAPWSMPCTAAGASRRCRSEESRMDFFTIESHIDFLKPKRIAFALSAL
jgi:preprotein translocase subunit SecD